MHLKSRRPLAGMILVAGIVLATGATVPSGAEPPDTRRESRLYLATTGQTVDCSSSQGGACFPLQGDELEAAIGVVDDLEQQPVSARFEFRGSGGAIIASGAFCDSETLAVPPGATQLAVMIAVADPIGCATPALASTGKVHLVTRLSDGELPPVDVEPQACLQPTPTAISVAGVTEPEDVGQRVNLNVYVLLDGVSEELGRAVMEKAAEAYEPLGIDMRAEYQPVSLPSGNGMLMLSRSINEVGGEVPQGFDVVHTLTSKTMNVWGQADCIGGVRYRDRSFSVSTGTLQDRPVQYLGPIEGRMINNLAANIVAHEIGHLMGGHHHYGNCVESQLREVESCTVMMDPGDPKELLFSTVNAAIVRAHAVRYATAEPIGEMGVIDVTVVRNGRLHAGAEVVATHATHEAASCVTGDDGRCGLHVPADSGYSVTARINPGAQGSQAQHDVTAPGEVHFTFGR